jgi:2-polyprenyl-3-methyl-5-hydroxy-6-metoxy-1,4-benzoquinol methylase
MKVSVVVATFNRGALLNHALMTYHRQTLDRDEWEYLLADDGSTDDTKAIVAYWQSKGLPIRYFDAARDLGRPKEPGKWRDGCGLRNSLSTHAFGEVIVSTHPEILVPPDALESMYRALSERNVWATAIPYWMPPAEDVIVGTAIAHDKTLTSLRMLPGFFDPSWPGPLEAPGAPDYRNQNQEQRTDWESEVFWGMRMQTWRWLGGFREFEQWGSVDMDFVGRRRVGGIPTLVVPATDPSPHASGALMVYHQNHGSERDMDLAMVGVRDTDYSSLQRMREQGGIYGNYHHGPRERSGDGTLSNILEDHVLRYQWAATEFQRAGKHFVLDAPCGTGYGAAVMEQSGWQGSYLGVDADTESILHARRHYGRASDRVFADVDLEKLATSLLSPRPGCDGVICFEGIEHIANQAGLIELFYQTLIPGGVLLLSTPQKGKTHGTPWDRYMLTAEELLALFNATLWNVEQFGQAYYGGPHPVRGLRPNDEIQIIKATRL